MATVKVVVINSQVYHFTLSSVAFLLAATLNQGNCDRELLLATGKDFNMKDGIFSCFFDFIYLWFFSEMNYS